MSNWEKRAHACLCVRSCVVRAVLTTFFESTISSTAPLLFQTPRKAKSTTHDDGNFGRRKYYSASCFPALPFFFLCHGLFCQHHCVLLSHPGRQVHPSSIAAILSPRKLPVARKHRPSLSLLVACLRFTRERTHQPEALVGPESGATSK